MKCEYPLGLPKGSIRAIMSIGLCAAAIVLYAYKGVTPDWLIGFAGMAIAWYFKTRDTE